MIKIFGTSYENLIIHNSNCIVISHCKQSLKEIKEKLITNEVNKAVFVESWGTRKLYCVFMKNFNHKDKLYEKIIIIIKSKEKYVDFSKERNLIQYLKKYFHVL